MIQVSSHTELTSEPEISSGEVLVWVPAAICLAMLLFFLLFGSVGSTGSGTSGNPDDSRCDSSSSGIARC
ncbi:MAG: hypothetical protein ABWX96_11025 [Propionibacteriaceae bacterium]